MYTSCYTINTNKLVTKRGYIMINFLELLNLTAGSQQETADMLSKEVGFNISQVQVSRNLKNEKNTFINYAAKNIIDKLPAPKIIPDDDYSKFPVYCKYPGQYEPQSAYIELNLENSTVYATYSSEIGCGVSSDVFNNITLRFSISCYLSNEQISDLINDNMYIFQFLMATHNVDYDNCNLKGFVNDELDSEAINDLYNYWHEIHFLNSEDGVNPYIHESLEEWLGDFHDYYSLNQGTFDDFCNELFNSNGEDHQYFPLEITDVELLQNAYLDVLAEKLYNGNDLLKEQAQLLIDDGRCADSQWTEELEEFAGK